MTDRNERGSRDYGRERGGRDSGRDDDRGSRGGREDSRDRGRGTASEDRGSSRGRDDDRDSGRSQGGSGSSRGFVYKPRTRESVEQRASQSSRDYDRFLKDHVPIYKPKAGDNRIRIVPATWDGADHYGLTIFVHYGVGPDRESYLDLDKMKGEPDPITEEMHALKRDGGSDQDVRDLESKKRVLVYVVDRDDEKAGVQAWPMSWTIDKDISVLSRDKETGGIIDVDDPQEGFDIEFRRDGEGLKTKYGAFSIARRPSRLGKPEWLDFAIDNPLPDQLVYFSYDEIAKTFGGGGAHRDRGRDDRDDDRGRNTESRDRDDRDSRDARGGRDDDRGSRDREPDRDSDRDRDAGRDRGRRAEPERGRSDEPELTWETVHAMTGGELDALCASDDRLRDVKPNDAKDDAELADWICEDLGLKKAEGRGRRAVVADSPPADAQSKLDAMRNERGRR